MKLVLSTPERLALSLPVAGVGSRVLAYLIDVGLLFGLGAVGYFAYSLLNTDVWKTVLDLSTTARVVALLAVFTGIFLYWTICEVALGGQTLGKRLLKVRVVRADGGPVTWSEAAVRNLLRIVDFFPSCYPVGLTVMLFDAKHRRLGDLAAGTVLIRETFEDLSRYELQELDLPSESQALVSEFFERSGALEPAARARVLSTLTAKLGLQGVVDEAGLRRALAAKGEAQPGSLSAFVSQRRPAWDELLSLVERLERRTLDLSQLERLSRLHRQTSADLATVQARFPTTGIDQALAVRLARAYRAMQGAPAPASQRLGRFFLHTYPRAVWEHRGLIRTSALLLGLGALVGAVAVLFDDRAAERLVDSPLRHFLAERRLWTDFVLDLGAPSEIATMIFTNNLRVLFSTFAGGLLLGVGSVGVLLANGLHVGSILAYAGQHGMAGRLLDFMAAHGPVELSLFALGGGAGLAMGRALLVPTEVPRLEALTHAARGAVAIVVGSAPLLVCIGVIEGFVSPGNLFPWWAKAAFGLASVTLLWRWLFQAGRAASESAVEELL